MSATNTDQVLINADVDEVYTRLRHISQGTQINIQNLTVITMHAMSLAERVGKESGDKGPAKKAMVVRVIQRLVNEIPMSEEDQKLMQAAIETVLPGLIDGLVAAARGEWILSAGRSCLRLCVPPKQK